MGEIIRFPCRRRESALLDGEFVRTRILTGEASLVGAFWFRGGNCRCYRLDLGGEGEVTYVFDIHRERPRS